MNYDGNNCDDIINVIQNSESILASRFHGVILGLVFKKKVLPIIYSNKTLNTLNDIGFKGNIIDIRELPNNTNIQDLIHNISFGVDTEYFSSISKKASLHFEQLDKVLL